ncbi:Chromatin structure-remodeling complex protein rsc9 [Ascosphaera acerosa]|nr:Chromatin structure-remodeling complex protein rsc9 [Ascosphaera acerosa]
MTSAAPMLAAIPRDTPSNKRGRFAQTAHAQRQREETHNPFHRPAQFDPLVFTALPEKTPRIYDHCVKGLESGVPSEVEFALHHLVIISDERGDKFRFCDFPGLADSLLEAAWELSFLVHGVSFEISYAPLAPADPRINVVDGCYGTPDLPARVARLPLAMADTQARGLEPVGLGRYARMVSEAALVVHNMASLEENAIWLADMPVFKDWVVYVLSLPPVAREKYVEIVNNALETAELVAPFWTFGGEDGASGPRDGSGDGGDGGDGGDALVPALLNLLTSNDRTHVLLALRILVCWGMDRPGAKKELLLGTHMSADILAALNDSLLLQQDRELLSACLDFIYQYTLVPANVAQIVKLIDAEIEEEEEGEGVDVIGDDKTGSSHLNPRTTLVPRLTDLLLFEAEPLLDARLDQPELQAAPPNDIPDLPPATHAELCALPEPARCTAWVRACFAQDEHCEITQLALWNAYRAMFAHVNEQVQLQQQQYAAATAAAANSGAPRPPPPQPALSPTLGAADFINTVSTAFPLAEAQVIRGEVAKFIIRGIRPLENPLDSRGLAAPRCKWRVSVSSQGTTTTAATVSVPAPGAGKGGAGVGVGAGAAAAAGAPAGSRTITKCETRCTRTFDDAAALRDHVFEVHLGLGRDAEGGWLVGDDARPQNICLWDECTEFQYSSHNAAPPYHHLQPAQQQQQQQQQQQRSPHSHDTPSDASAAPSAPRSGPATTSTLVKHILASHMPRADAAADRSRPRPPVPRIPPRPFLQHRVERVFEYFPTPADKEPVGIAYKALLVLRNLMRNLPPDRPRRSAISSGEGRQGGELSGGGGGASESSSGRGSRHSSSMASSGSSWTWSQELFLSQRRRLVETADYNPVLRREIFELVNEI